MAEVTILIKGRQYDIACDDGQEERVLKLATYIDNKIKMISRSGSAYNESHLMVLTTLVLADEIFEARENSDGDDVEKLEEIASNIEDKEAIKIIKKLSKRVDNLTAKLREVS